MGLNIAAFTCVKLFPVLADVIGIHGCFTIFASACFFGSIFIHYVMAETKGKSMETFNTISKRISQIKTKTKIINEITKEKK